MAQLIQKWEEIVYEPKAASTVFNAGEFVSYNGSGQIKPLDATEKVAGLVLQDVAAADADYASATAKLPIQKVLNNRFTATVSGTASAAKVGLTYDILSSDSAVIDLSTGGTQFRLVEFISATLGVFEVATLLAA